MYDINLEYDARKKSVGIAYLLLLLFGIFGVHRMYAGYWASGLSMLMLLILGVLFSMITLVILAGVLIWWLGDWLYTATLVKDANLKLLMQLKEHQSANTDNAASEQLFR